jgi:hypothetical protein
MADLPSLVRARTERKNEARERLANVQVITFTQNRTASLHPQQPARSPALQLIDGLADPLQYLFFAEHFKGLEQRWRVLLSTNGDSYRLEHLPGFEA